MKAFLLGAGKGTRLAPRTDFTPKCLMPIHGTPILEIWINLLEKYGITDILINTHHHAEQVEEFIKGIQKKHGVNITLFHEPVLKGSGGTVLSNRDFVSDEGDFIIAYADNLTHVNFDKMIDFHLRHCLPNGGCLTMGVRRVEDPSGCGIAVLDDDKKILRFVEKPSAPVDGMANCGIYVVSEKIFDVLPPDLGNRGGGKEGAIDFGHHILPLLAGRMYGCQINEFLMDIGTPDSYEQALREWKDVDVKKKSV